MWATSDDIAFRFPRRQIAVAGVQRETATLPGLAGELPAPIPDAAYPGTPSTRFPWPWFGSRLIAGREVALARIHPVRLRALAAELGQFLGCLHSLRPSIATALPSTHWDGPT